MSEPALPRLQPEPLPPALALALVQRLADELCGAGTRPQIATVGLRALLSACGARHGSLAALLVRGEGQLETYSLHADWDEAVAEPLQALDASTSLAVAVRTGHSSFGEREACIPMRAGGTVVGAARIALQSGALRPDLRTLLLALSQQCALALERDRLLCDLKASIVDRDLFLTVASHELKTPLTALQLAVQSAAKSLEALPGPDEVQKSVQGRLRAAERQTRKLTALVDRLLDLERLAQGGLPLEVGPVDLAALVRDVVERQQAEIARAGCGLSVRSPASLPARSDIRRIELLLQTLLSNALKYGAGTRVTVELEEHCGTARLQVRDDGIGLDPKDHERVFERFERAVSSREYSGFGLGLFLARQVAVALGGTIRVSSALGKGATFTVALPLAGPSEP